MAIGVHSNADEYPYYCPDIGQKFRYTSFWPHWDFINDSLRDASAQYCNPYVYNGWYYRRCYF
jgi:hypothetical protein